MSGHSKWSQIKRQKAVTDNKRGNLFTRLAKAITVAAKQGGKDPSSNFKLRLTMEKAKSANMPNDNIDRAIKRGSGELSGGNLEEVTYEGFGPGGIAIIVQATTDNKNRTTGAVRNILSKHQGNLGNNNSVLWMFDQKGTIRILKENMNTAEDFELKLIDAGAEDIINEDEGFVIYTRINDLPKVKDFLENNNVKVESAELELVPKNKASAISESEKKKLNKIFEELEADDDVNNYFTNADL